MLIAASRVRAIYPKISNELTVVKDCNKGKRIDAYYCHYTEDKNTLM
jgi:hypothetical protein